MDMLALAVKAMGIDPLAIMAQAEGLGRAFDVIGQSCARLELAVARLEAGQLAMMTEMGLYVPPPTEEQAALIALESRRHAEQFGGLVIDATQSE